MASNVPATACSSYPNQNPLSNLVIGNAVVPYGGPWNGPAYWFVAIDLTNLAVVQNIISKDPVNVPPPIQALLGNSRYFLFFIANYQSTMNMIQGSLYAFLRAVGSGAQLAGGEQAIEQLGTAQLINFSYVLAATMDDNDVPGFELFSTTDYVVLTMQFMPITVNGQTIYTPIQTS
jgi:hypothetical protein